MLRFLSSTLLAACILSLLAGCDKTIREATYTCNTDAGYSVVDGECVCEEGKGVLSGYCTVLPPNIYLISGSVDSLNQYYLEFTLSDSGTTATAIFHHHYSIGADRLAFARIVFGIEADSVVIPKITFPTEPPAQPRGMIFLGRLSEGYQSMSGKLYVQPSAEADTPDYRQLIGTVTMKR